MTTQTTIPEGWKLVPIEPTDAMLDALAEGINAHHETGYDGTEEGVSNCIVTDEAEGYRAMLVAAPKPPEAQ